MSVSRTETTLEEKMKELTMQREAEDSKALPKSKDGGEKMKGRGEEDRWSC